MSGIWKNSVLIMGLLSLVSCAGSSPKRDIVFARGEGDGISSYRLVRMGADGSNQRAFLANPGIAQVNVPDWAPDGSRLLFTSEQTILVVNEDGSGVEALQAGDFSFREWPAWSPDGTEILFNAGPSGSEQDLYVMNADGSDLRQLTADPGREYCGRWSPDGARIVYTSLVADTFRLMVMGQDGAAKESVFPAGFDAECADWSPDGGRLAFSSTPGHDFPPLADFADWAAVTEIYVLDIGTGEVWPVTDLGGASSRPRWSPDGRRVVFHSSASIGAVAPSDPRFWPAMEIYVSNEDGSDLRRLTDNQLVDIHPSW